MEVARLSIGGMHCSACSSTIEKNLLKLESIKNVKINVVSGKAKISHENSINTQEIINLINSYGFSASVDNSKELEIKYINDLKKRFFVAVPCFLVIFILHMSGWHSSMSALLQLLFASFVQFYCAYPFYKASLSVFKTKSADMNVLIALGTSVAYFYSLYLFFYDFGDGYYFEGSSSIICFVLFGEYIKSKAKKNANDELGLLTQILPQKARILKDNNQTFIDISDIKKGDKCLVIGGEKIPLDGVILSGEAEVSSTHINGEEMPRNLKVGDLVVAGSVVYHGEIMVESTKDSSEFFVYEMLDLLELSHVKKPKIGILADKIASIFVPLVLLISMVAFMFWVSIGYSPIFALSIAACILVVSCPCALGLAVPLAIVCASIRAKRDDILIKTPEIYEKTKDIKYIAFDKTGTLTRGEIMVKDFFILESSYDQLEILKIAKAMQENNPHPIAKAILNFTNNYESCTLDKKEYFVAKGIKASVRGEEYYFGALDWVCSQVNCEFSGARNNAVAFGNSSKIIAVFYLSDSIRDEAYDVVKWLKRENITPVILSGDNEESVRNVAKELKIDEFYFNLAPTKKVEKIIELNKSGGVCFVGDGINDALALKEASFGISFVGATELAKEVGDVLLLKNSLKGIVSVFKISKQTLKNIQQNLFFAYIYNIVLIPVAFGILYPFGILLTPTLAGMAMAFSSISVVSNALRILRFNL